MQLKKMIPFLVTMLMIHGSNLSAETEKDSALWAGGLALFEREKGLDYSVEYQLRLDENMSSFSNQFLEVVAYRKTTQALLLNGGYRFTNREDHNESRVYLGGFWNITKSLKQQKESSSELRAVLQIGYQHDFNARFDDRQMGSNSIRWILLVSKPVTKTIRPFFLAGVLTTWNEAYDFGIDKTRVGGGVVWNSSEQTRIRCQYIFEKFFYTTPEKNTNIIWLRLEMTLRRLKCLNTQPWHY